MDVRLGIIQSCILEEELAHATKINELAVQGSFTSTRAVNVYQYLKVNYSNHLFPQFSKNIKF